jgi:hypothetical protein
MGVVHFKRDHNAIIYKNLPWLPGYTWYDFPSGKETTIAISIVLPEFSRWFQKTHSPHYLVPLQSSIPESKITLESFGPDPVREHISDGDQGSG